MREAAWDKVLESDFFTVAEQFRLRQVSARFNALLTLGLKDPLRTKHICKDAEVRALVRLLGDLPPPAKLWLFGPEITSKSVVPLITSSAFQSFSLQGCPVDKINDNTLALVGNNAPHLAHLQVDCRALFLGSRNGYNGSRQNTVTDAGFKLIASNCPEVESLSLIWVRSLSGEGVADLCTQMKRLQQVKIWWCNCTEKVLLALSTREELRELDLRTCKEPAVVVPVATADPVAPPTTTEEIGLKRIFTRCTKLTKLSLVDVASCNDSALGELGLGYIKSLTHLFLSDLDITNQGLEALCLHVAPGLTHLHVSHLKAITNQGLAKFLAACVRLEHLEVCWLPSVNDEMLGEIAKLAPSRLRSIKLDGLKEVTTNGLAGLVKSVPGLGYLQCFNSKCHSAAPLLEHNKRLRITLAAW